MELEVYEPQPRDAHTRDAWHVDDEAPELLVDSTGTTLAIMAVTFKGDKEEQKKEQLANGRRVVAAVNAFKGLPNAAIEKIDVGQLLVLLQQAQRLVPPGLLPMDQRPTEGLWVDIENALKGFRSVGFDHVPYRHVDMLDQSWVDPRIQPFDVTERVLGEFTTEAIEAKPKDIGVEAITDSNNIGLYSYAFSQGFELPAEAYRKRYGLKHPAITTTMPDDELSSETIPDTQWQSINDRLAIGLGFSPKVLIKDNRAHPDTGLDLTNRSPRIYDERCGKCGSITTGDVTFSCTPDLCIFQPTISETA